MYRDQMTAVRQRKASVSERRRELTREYAAGLQHYLSHRDDEPALARAHELGRKALTDGLGVLEMATIHSQAIVATLDERLTDAAKTRLLDGRLTDAAKTQLLDGRLTDAAKTRLLDGLERFFVQALAPFEMAHRGFWEANVILHRLNDVLEGQAKRIAFALHDEAAQLLAAVHLALADLARRLPSKHAQDLQAARGLLDQIEQRLRNLAHELRPPILDDLGLVPALEFLAESMAKRSGCRVTVEASIERALPAIVETTLYRITQEALNNVWKHAKATHVAIVVRRHADRIVCSIQDNGIGLKRKAPASGARSGGLGLFEIQERAAALGGQLRLSGPDTPGTDVTIEIPLER
jgi:signal transduction histidine kinase